MGVCKFPSRRTFWQAQGSLCEGIAHSVKARRAVLDGELVCLGDDGRSLFHRLLFRRDWPCLFAFDLLEVDGEDLRDQPLSALKRGLRQILPRTDSRLLFVDHLERRGSALFRAACDRDLEGIVAKWRHGRYERDGVSTSWLKIKNPGYSQMAGRRELVEARHSRARRTGTVRRPDSPPPHDVMRKGVVLLGMCSKSISTAIRMKMRPSTAAADAAAAQ